MWRPQIPAVLKGINIRENSFMESVRLTCMSRLNVRHILDRRAFAGAVVGSRRICEVLVEVLRRDAGSPEFWKPLRNASLSLPDALESASLVVLRLETSATAGREQ
jgi:hypothetical protein